MIHTPKFQVIPGRDSYRWITDRGKKIALLGLSGGAYLIDAIHLFPPTGKVPDYDEPEVLHNYTMRGTRLTLTWFHGSRPVQPTLGWDSSDPQFLKLWVEEREQDGPVAGRFDFSLHLDKERGSYVYEFDCQGDAAKAEALEYVNLMAVGVDDTRPAKTRYPITLYRNTDGELIQLPRHHCTTPDLYKKDIRPGGIAGFFGEAENPVIEVLDAPSKTHIDVCMCLHDVHFIGHAAGNGSDGRNRFHARYRLYGVDAKTSTKLVEQSRKPDHTPETLERYGSFSPAIGIGVVNDMEHGIDVRTDNSSFYFEREQYDWEQPDYWDRSTGHSGQSSVRITSSSPARRSLRMGGGQAFITPGTLIDAGVWVKTEKVAGRGAYLEIELARWAGATLETLLLLQTARVTGTSDWTYLRLPPVPAPERAEYVYLRLVLEGPGAVWFDDMLLCPQDHYERIPVPLRTRQAVPVKAKVESGFVARR